MIKKKYEIYNTLADNLTKTNRIKR